jgi:hypothetical protein
MPSGHPVARESLLITSQISVSEGDAAATQISHICIISSPDGTEPRSAQIA